jgi:hypothetical protein
LHNEEVQKNAVSILHHHYIATKDADIRLCPNELLMATEQERKQCSPSFKSFLSHA